MTDYGSTITLPGSEVKDIGLSGVPEELLHTTSLIAEKPHVKTGYKATLITGDTSVN